MSRAFAIFLKTLAGFAIGFLCEVIAVLGGAHAPLLLIGGVVGLWWGIASEMRKAKAAPVQ